MSNKEKLSYLEFLDLTVLESDPLLGFCLFVCVVVVVVLQACLNRTGILICFARCGFPVALASFFEDHLSAKLL